MRLTIAGLQHPGHPGDVEANLAVVAEAAREARSRGADVLVTPEMFVTGYNIGDRVAELARRPLVEEVARVAAEAGVAVVAGLPELLPDGQVANTALFVDETGTELARYRKTHLFSRARPVALRRRHRPAAPRDLPGRPARPADLLRRRVPRDRARRGPRGRPRGRRPHRADGALRLRGRDA